MEGAESAGTTPIAGPQVERGRADELPVGHAQFPACRAAALYLDFGVVDIVVGAAPPEIAEGADLARGITIEQACQFQFGIVAGAAVYIGVNVTGHGLMVIVAAEIDIGPPESKWHRVVKVVVD